MFGPDGPDRAELDRILPDRPAFFFGIDGHSLWANSTALEMARVKRDTPDPIPGFSYYARDTNGDPTGYILEVNAVLGLVDVEPISPDTMGTLMEGWLPKASAADAGVPPIGDDQAALPRLYADVETARCAAVPRRRVLFGPLRTGRRCGRRARGGSRKQVSGELMSVDVVTIVGDGTQGGYAAWLVEPYSDKPDSTGGSPFTEEQWSSSVRSTPRGTTSTSTPAGKRTARVDLDAVERAIAGNPPRDRRHAIAHLVFVEDSDNPRFGELGVTAKRPALPPAVSAEIRRPDLAGTDWPAAGYFSTYKTARLDPGGG